MQISPYGECILLGADKSVSANAIRQMGPFSRLSLPALLAGRTDNWLALESTQRGAQIAVTAVRSTRHLRVRECVGNILPTLIQISAANGFAGHKELRSCSEKVAFCQLPWGCEEEL